MAKKKTIDSPLNLPLKKQAVLLSGNGMWETNAIPLANVKPVVMHDGPLGLRIPQEGTHYVTATCFPAPSLSACSWDKDLLNELGKAFAYECIERNTDILLAPGINIKRNPLCGRNFEYYSEDPLLAGKLGAAFINGLQGEGVGASLKHFAANSCETGRFIVSSEVDKRALMEIYLRGFEIAVKESKPWTVMCSYNRINGTYSSQNEWLLDAVLRKTWGYKGVVVSDWGAVLDPVTAHARGLDLEMPCNDKKRASLLASATRRGILPKKRFNDEVKHLLDLEKKARKRPQNLPKTKQNLGHKTALKVALESVVLAKNDGVLPLKSLKNCCVIGLYAKEPCYMGDGSAEVYTESLKTFYDEASKRLGAPIPYAQGFDPLGKEDEDNLRLDALELASKSDTVLLFLGSKPHDDHEGYDRPDMRLPENQLRLLEAVSEQNKNIILFLSGGAPVELPFLSKVRGLFLTYLIGEVHGEALIPLLLGEKNPSGHLAETWPLRYIDCPSSLTYPSDSGLSLYKESIFVGYRYYLTAEREVLFPFGHGLSYSKFSLSKGKMSVETLREGKSVTVSGTVKNTSKRDGAVLLQCYVGYTGEKSIHPLRELKDFAKIFVKAGESQEFSFTLPYETFAHFSETSDGWVVSDGEYRIEIGFNCQDIQIQKSLKVVSSYKERDRRYVLPSYYKLPSNGALRISDEEFEILLGHSVFKNARKSRKRFRRNSTFGEIKNTFIGKIILKRYMKMNEGEKDPVRYKANIDTFLLTPIRFAVVFGFDDRKINAVVSMANRNPLGALWHLIFG